MPSSSPVAERHRRTVFRDIGTRAWFDYLGWANPVEHPQRVHFGRGKMEAGSDLLIDNEADFTRLPIDRMLNLHVHRGHRRGGNDMKYDNDDSHPNSYVYDIAQVVDRNTLRLGMPATGMLRFGPGECDIRWSSYILPDLPRLERLYPYYCVVQVNNVFNMPKELGGKRLVAYPHPQVIFQYYDGRTGELAYAESVSTARE